MTVIRPKGRKVNVSMRFDESVSKAVKVFADTYRLKVPDVVALLLATGVDALTADGLKPFGKILYREFWDWIARNKPYIERVKKLHAERLKELRDKIEVKEEEAE
jgi:hypothetical protein